MSLERQISQNNKTGNQVYIRKLSSIDQTKFNPRSKEAPALSTANKSKSKKVKNSIHSSRCNAQENCNSITLTYMQWGYNLKIKWDKQ